MVAIGVAGRADWNSRARGQGETWLGGRQGVQQQIIVERFGHMIRRVGIVIVGLERTFFDFVFTAMGFGSGPDVDECDRGTQAIAQHCSTAVRRRVGQSRCAIAFT